MNPEHARAFVLGLLAGVLAVFVSMDCRAEEPDRHYFGINTISRHFTGDHEKYNEQNFGIFYERSLPDRTGFQVGYYRNSFFDSTFYAAAYAQPWSLGPVDIGYIAGVATGYKRDPFAILTGGIITWHYAKGAAIQGIVAPVVAGLQFKWEF